MEKKRSLKLLIVSACLALLLVSIGGIIAGASEPVTIDDDLKINGASLDLNDKISIAFAVKADAIGYTEGEKLGYALYLYDSNPGTEAGNGKKVEDFVVRTIGGEQYVLFITDGYTALEYKNTVYARLGNTNGTVFGTTQKTGVLELAYKQQAKFQAQLETATDENKDSINTRVKLFSAIINYGINADLVVSGTTKYSHSYITVADGYIDDGNGGKWTSGVYANGTALNFVPNKDYGVPTAWTDGTATFGSEFTVSANANVAFKGYDMTFVDTNPWVSNWSSASTETWDENRIKQFIANQTEAIYPAINRDPAKAVAGKEGSVYLNENGSVTYLSTLAQRYYSGKTAALGFDGAVTKQQYYTFNTANNKSKIQNDQPLTFSFNINFPENDLNGNGITYDVGAHKYTETIENGKDPDTDEPIYVTNTYYANGDMFRNPDNPTMVRFPLFISNSPTGTGNVMMYIGFQANYATKNGVKVVDSWSLRTSVGGADKNVTYGADKFDIREDHDVDVELVPAADGTVAAVNIFVDGILCATHTAEKGTAAYGLVANTHTIFNGTATSTYVGMRLDADCGRFVGDYEVSNVQLKYNNFVEDANELPEGYSMGATIAGYAADKTTPHYAWSDLVDGEQHAFLTGTTADKNWYYDAYTDSIIVTKNSTSAGYGAINFLLENPLYGKQADWNGKVAVFEFTMNMLPMDTNKDGKFNTAADVCGAKSSVWGQINIGYGDGLYDYSRAFNHGSSASKTVSGISANTGLLGNFRLWKINTSDATTTNQWRITYYNQTTSSDSSTNLFSNISHGTYKTIKFVVTPDAETGAPTQLDIYVDGTFVLTRYNKIDGATGFTWNATGIGAHDNFFNAPYFEISQFVRAEAYQVSSFSNFRSWAE